MLFICRSKLHAAPDSQNDRVGNGHMPRAGQQRRDHKGLDEGPCGPAHRPWPGSRAGRTPLRQVQQEIWIRWDSCGGF